MSLVYPEESYAVIGACMAVYKDKGCGFVEPVYQECVEIELGFQDIPFQAQSELELTYRGQVLNHRYIPDVTCYDKIIVELKAVAELTDVHRAQVMNYLKATGFKLGLLVNFGHHPGLQYERIVNTKGRLNS
ncbi:MAG: GxxExxY protein [Lentisphaeria bacterium]|nr:GxxExxY protein [Lentisphaeria bacterium]